MTRDERRRANAESQRRYASTARQTEHAPTGPHYYDDGIWRPYDEALTKLATAEAEITRLEAELAKADRINGDFANEMKDMDPLCPKCRSSKECMNILCPTRPTRSALEEELATAVEMNRRLVAESDAAQAEVATLREAVLVYKAERDADEWGDDEALMARQMRARQRMFGLAATPTATAREGEPSG